MGVVKSALMNHPFDYKLKVVVWVAASSPDEAKEILGEIFEEIQSRRPEILGFEIVEDTEEDE